MKVLVFGSRRWLAQKPIMEALREFPPDTTIIHGNAPGADRIAGFVASILGFTVKVYPADWKLYGKAAGPIRNAQMLADHPDLDLALGFTLGDTPGSMDMLKRLESAGIPTRRYNEDLQKM